MSFLSRSSGNSPADTEARKEAVKAEVRSQLAIANAQELINKMGDKCFAKCITKPSETLGSSEQSCITRCSERYLEAFNIVSKSYVARVSKEREGAGGLTNEQFI